MTVRLSSRHPAVIVNTICLVSEEKRKLYFHIRTTEEDSKLSLSGLRLRWRQYLVLAFFKVMTY